MATENAAVETYKDKKIEAGAKHSAAAKDIQAEDAQNTQKTKQGTEESFSDTLSQNGSERGQSEALLQSETPKSATSTLDFQELTDTAGCEQIRAGAAPRRRSLSGGAAGRAFGSAAGVSDARQ